MSSKQIRTARRYYECPDTSYAHDRSIKPGNKYVRVTIFPHDDVFAGDKPWQYAQCLECGLADQVITRPNCGANWLGVDAEMYWRGHQELAICGLINELVADLENRA